MTFWATPQLPKPEGRPHQESPFNLFHSSPLTHRADTAHAALPSATLLSLGKARTSSALLSLTRSVAFGDTALARHSSSKLGSALAYSQRSPLALRADTAPARHSSSKLGSALAYSQRSPFTIFINCVLCHCRWYSIACRGELSCQ